MISATGVRNMIKPADMLRQQIDGRNQAGFTALLLICHQFTWHTDLFLTPIYWHNMSLGFVDPKLNADTNCYGSAVEIWSNMLSICQQTSIFLSTYAMILFFIFSIILVF